MLKRGKSVEFIHSYIGMPVAVIEGIQKKMNLDGSLRASGNIDRVRINQLISAEPIAPDYRAMHREELHLRAVNRAFVRRLKEAA